MFVKISNRKRELNFFLRHCHRKFGNIPKGNFSENIWAWPGVPPKVVFSFFHRKWESEILDESRWGLNWMAGLSLAELKLATQRLPEFFKRMGAVSVAVRIPMSQHSFVQIVEEAGFIYSGGLVTLSAIPQENPTPIKIKKERLRTAEKKEQFQLEKIAFSAFKEGRFYHETGLKEGAAQKIYSAWAKNAVNYADEIWVTGVKKLTGFVSLKKDKGNKRLWIDLIAVVPRAQGRGLGSILIEKSLESVRQLKGWTLGVKTEPENLEALRFYLKNSFELESFQLDYIWRKNRQK